MKAVQFDIGNCKTNDDINNLLKKIGIDGNKVINITQKYGTKYIAWLRD